MGALAGASMNRVLILGLTLLYCADRQCYPDNCIQQATSEWLGPTRKCRSRQDSQQPPSGIGNAATGQWDTQFHLYCTASGTLVSLPPPWHLTYYPIQAFMNDCDV